MHNVLRLLVTRPRDVPLAGFQWHADGVHAGDEVTVFSQKAVHGAAHPGHNAHIHGHIGRVSQLDADVCDRGAERPHAEGDHVHRAPTHATVKQVTQDLLHLLGVNPVVGWSGIGLAQGADEGPVFDAGDVTRVGACQEAVGPFRGVEPDESAGLDHLLTQAIVLLL